MNLKRTTLEPELPTQVVIDRETVGQRPIGATAWSTVEGREYDEVEKDDVQKDDVPKKDGERAADLKRTIRGVALDSEFLDR